MGRSTTPLSLLLLFVLLALTPAVKTQPIWPVKRQIDLSSSFGEYRLNRFHAGIDIRTGAKIGTRVYSPVSGYVWRIKMSYYGYGKGLYIMGKDGHIYVFGHLHDFAPKIDTIVKRMQTGLRRYYLDTTFDEGSISIARGEYIGLSGRTGAKAPHLHFEKRTPDNHPVNPLIHGFSIRDRVKPVFRRLGLSIVDDSSLFPNGRRKRFLPVAGDPATGVYRLDTTIDLSAPFGLLVDAYDLTRQGGMKQAVHRLSLYFDDTLFYEVTFDTVYFDYQRSINLEYDLDEILNDEKKVRRLFHLTGNRHPRSRAISSDGGIYGLDGDISPGPHRGRILAEDCAGNTAELTFDFIWDPQADDFRPVPDSSTPATVSAAFEHNVVEDGLLISLRSDSAFPGTARVKLYFRDSLLGTETLRYLSPHHRACFIPPTEKYRRIDRLACVLSDGRWRREFSRDSLNIFLAGSGRDGEEIALDSTLVVRIGRQHLFEPRYIELVQDSLDSSLLHLLPEAFACRQDFVVSFMRKISDADSGRYGVCWLDEGESEWVWLTTTRVDGRHEAEVTGGGGYAVLRDSAPPAIGISSIKNGLTYFNPRHPVEFYVDDALAGIEDDRNILIELDGRWMIPEYDPETKLGRTVPLEPLADGRHDLRLVVTDRAGNRAEREIHFFVKKQ
ncbi:MAG: M23 family metallopeptidase [Candidatus Zixiibacteriota bacterium]|nr:MAG: M23 family metallopeptidase [candidate division Zixibacteria bacterium]